MSSTGSSAPDPHPPGRLRSLANSVVAAARAWGGRTGDGAATASWGVRTVDRTESGTEGPDPRVAACALLLEVADADGELSEAERKLLSETLGHELGLPRHRAERLLRDADRARSQAPGIWVFTGVVVDAFTVAQRQRLAGLLDRLSRVDREPGWQERYVVEKLCALLRVQEAVYR